MFLIGVGALGSSFVLCRVFFFPVVRILGFELLVDVFGEGW